MERSTKKTTMYEIGKDLLALNDLLESLVDDDGNPREPTEEEQETLKSWFQMSYSDFETKFDSYCKFIKNQKIAADIAESERKVFKDEMDRLSKRAKACENRAKSLQTLLQWNMETINTHKFKSELFTATIQEGQVSVAALAGSDLSKIPEKFLKPREIDTTAIKQAIKDGKLLLGKDIPGTSPLKASHLFDAETKEEIPNIYWTKTPFLVIR